MDPKILFYLFKSLRPRQWLKSLAVFAALIFSGWLFVPDKLHLELWAFVILSMMSSGVYIINDLVDRPQDRLHPFKKERPIASGKLPPVVAAIASATLIMLAVLLSMQLRASFFAAVIAFLFLQLAYSFFLKHIILIDVMAIAASFTLRVYAGAFIIGAHVNVWFLLTIVSVALFLAIGKRRSELTILQGQSPGQHRATLYHYPESLLDILTAMFATATWLTYSIFTFNYPTPTPQPQIQAIIAQFLPESIEQSKWLMISVPFVIYGVMRYLYIVYEKKEGESPERVILSDKPLLATVVLYIISVLIVLYGLNPQ